MKQYIVLGGGISGCTAAFSLAEAGHKVTVVERSSAVGGKVLEYCCKATDSCSRCGVCIAHTGIRNALIHPNISFLTGTEPVQAAVRGTGGERSLQLRRLNPGIDYSKCEFCGACIEACPEKCISLYRRGELMQYVIDYEKCLLHRGKSCTACGDACPAEAVTGKTSETLTTLAGDDVLVATGHTPFPAEQKPRYGYGRSDKIITGAEAEARLSSDLDLGDVKDIAFIQCVGSRDPVINRNYCSAVCCSYALRLARILKYRRPDTAVTIYYIDLQNFDKEFTLLKQEIIHLGVQFRRGIPFRIDELSTGRLRFMIENMDDENEETIVEHDLAVLSVGMGPDAAAAEVARLFGIEQDPNGFFVSADDPVYSVGTCREPQSIPESIAEAQAAALQLQEDLHE